MRLLTCVTLFRVLVLLVVRDVLVANQEENHLTLLILNGHNIQQTPELGTCSGHTDGKTEGILLLRKKILRIPTHTHAHERMRTLHLNHVCGD